MTVPMKDLAKVNSEEQIAFLNAFDYVFCDVDGVLLLANEPIPGAVACVNSLKKLGKNVSFVSNNATNALDVWHKLMNTHGFEIEKENIITPTVSIIWYLKKIKFNRELIVLGTKNMKSDFKAAGFKVADEGLLFVEENLTAVKEIISNLNGNVGAIIADIDFNISFIKMQKVIEYIKNKDVLFLSGAQDSKLPIGEKLILLGPKYYVQGIEEISGRKAFQLGKPSIHLKDVLSEKIGISSSTRVLFIGDSINEDMNFATKCDYKKLLVLTGVTKKQHIENWEHPEELKPTYYIESLNCFKNIIDNINNDFKR